MVNPIMWLFKKMMSLASRTCSSILFFIWAKEAVILQGKYKKNSRKRFQEERLLGQKVTTLVSLGHTECPISGI